jgi:hypothetical protein
MRSDRGGRPSIVFVHTTQVIYMMPAAASASDTPEKINHPPNLRSATSA